MKLIVIRHGESMADILNVIEGRADFELTEDGILQATKMSGYISEKYNVDQIYCSPLKRAKQTAEILSVNVKIPVIYKEDLMEFNNGKLAGLSREVAGILYPKKENLGFEEAMYDMESLQTFSQRAERILNDLIKNSGDNETIVIVSHGGLINRLYHSFLKLDFKSFTPYPSGNTGIHIWEINNLERKILISNYLGHIDISHTK